jgi:Branched-chain amino acid ABC-type transport system, permease components
MLRTVYDRDESFQLLLTFALVLMFQDVFKFVWGANPRSLDSGYLDLWHDQGRRLQHSGL